MSIERRQRAVNHRQSAILFGGALALVIAGLSCSGGGGDKVSGPSTPVVPVGTRLMFAQQPTRTLLGRSLNPVVTVQVVDAQGSVVSTGSMAVSLALRTSSGAPASLSGTATQVTVGGVATFSGLVAAVDGDNMTLVASAPGLAAATSEKFKVDPPPVGIDSTVLHLVSDSAARASGLYVFEASGSSSLGLDSGRVMVGAEQGGFLRRIIHVDRAGSTFRVQTVAASLDEIMQNDSVVVHLTLGSGTSTIRAQRGLIVSKPPRFIPATGAVAATATEGEYSVRNLTLFADASSGNAFVVTNGSMSLRPTVDLSVTWGGLLNPKSAHLAFGGTATFDATYDVGFSQGVARTGSFLLGQITYPFTIPVPTPFGPVPVPAVFNVPITLEWSASATGKIALEFGWTSTANSTIGADWTSGAGWVPINSATLNFSPQMPSPQVNAALTARLGLKTTPRLVIAGTVGGDLWAQPFAEGVATADLVQNQWATSCHSAVQLGVDVDLKIFGFVIGAYNKSTTLLDTPWPVCAQSGTIVPVPAPVASVSVSPPSASIPVNGVQTFTATLKDASGNTLTARPITWSSSNEGVATVNSSTGVAMGLATGTATIKATSEAKTGTATITVTLVPVASVTVSPSAASIAIGGTQQFTATLKDASSNTLTGRPITWSSSNEGVATVNSATGVATGLAAGTVTVTATSEGKRGTGTITVTVTLAPVASVTISPATASLAIGGTQSFTATLKDASGNTLTGRPITWASSNEGVATVNSSTGVATGVAAGTATITATCEGKTGTATITVTAVTPALSITTTSLPAATVGIGYAQPVLATGGQTPYTWSVGSGLPSGLAINPSVGSIFGTPTAAGTFNFTVTVSDASNPQQTISKALSITVSVLPLAPVASVTVAPPTASILVGGTQQFTPTVKDGNGNTLTDRAITWSTSNPNIATVNNATGVATGVASGTATITASSEGKSGAATITVTQVPVFSVTVAPSTASIPVGANQSFTTTIKDVNGNILTGRPITWSSNNEGVATVNSATGVATGIAAGTATITAASEGKTGTATITVTAATSALSISTTSLPAATVGIGYAQPVLVTGGQTPYTWLVGSGLPPGLAINASFGSIFGTPNAAGTFNFTVTVSDASSPQQTVAKALSITVTLVPVASVTVSPATAPVVVGGTQQFTATLKDANGNTLTGRPITWSSSNEGVATVNSVTGVATGVATGTATITATSEGKTGTATISVSLAPLPSPIISSPGSPTAPGPTLATLTPTFTWIAVSGATGYGLVIRDLTTNQLVFPNASGTITTPLTGTSFGLPAGVLVYSHAYRWAMTSFNGPTESTAQSALLYFQSSAPPPLAPPAITGPGSATAPGPVLSSLTPTFSWTAESGATSYGLYVRDLTTNGLLTVTGLTGTSYALPAGYLFASHDYRWAMTSFNGTIESTSQSSLLYFRAPLATGLFNIEVRYLTGGGGQAPTAFQMAAFDKAASRIQKIITAKLGSVPISAAPGSCGANSPAINETVDDLLIFVTLRQIDGLNTIVGTGGACLVRSGSYKPIVGLVNVDVADLAWVEANGQLEDVALHEMMHALGFGVLWGPNFFNLLVSPSRPNSPGVDTRFSGANAITGFNEIGGSTYTLGQKVPVENTASVQADEHWRESVLVNELMQPFIAAGRPSPLSRLTLRSLQDLGYSVDLSQADQFTIPAPGVGLRADQPAPIRTDDIARVPIRIVDRQGRVVRVVNP